MNASARRRQAPLLFLPRRVHRGAHRGAKISACASRISTSRRQAATVAGGRQEDDARSQAT